ncbi:F0F1 ATP synthase subunit delta [Oceanobacillus iheyensis]|uniref:ATP synthase subunit delta n=1 Tax=Oceanobacillus iheyensis (strain DSM 14371 / CIP 107618 / JCM 11309 / KCTC 3954 / HTE831) TaxID=221109 RepID=ATPD_OCEIH|nr:F0F1 ATP synthase subunit delta [Oceanobacillus iheyensis]Q8EM80.1 RecName: Full=ATP synthase subunit delta; AltName: Full=ATP synthase F(1) sector subunit delta; AltName: Full=F-type ATPase subunit delta; Short=F-ATPase subunit delta [Oceanobacillus iheyensis HTE831]BAC14934.1 H(+)-transporting ATP synthase delta chain [Oceanobacillus iheyensis HTE831]
MSNSVVAKRYADALFQLGREKNSLDQLVADFLEVRQIFTNDQKLNVFLKHPKIDNEKKKQFLADVFKGADPVVINTLKLLVDRHRTSTIPSIVDHLVALVNDTKGIADATVYSIRELNTDEKEQLQTSFAKRLGKRSVQITNVVDPKILGGMKIRVGNTIYDGTVSNKLNRISRSIVSANK